MIDNQSVLGVITARGGSKGVPRKNIRDVCGKPLIAYSIEQGLVSETIDRLILSSEDSEIIAVAQEWGCEAPFMRPQELATDEATTLDALRHVMDTIDIKYDWLVLLQPTSPLRAAEDIDASIRLAMDLGAPAVVSVCETDKSPYWMYELGQNSKMTPIITTDGWRPSRRQDLPKSYALNGAIFSARTDWLYEKGDFINEETVAYVMSKDASVDIDTELDLKYFEFLMSLNA